MQQFFVPHYKSIQGRLVPLGRLPVGPADQAEQTERTEQAGWKFTAVCFEKLQEKESGRLMDVLITKTATPEPHINIWITDRPGDRKQ